MPQKQQQKVKATQSLERKRSKRNEDDLTETGEPAEQDDWMQAKALVKPDDQLELTDVELKEEFTRILTANNPHAPQNIVRYSFKERQFKQMSSVDQLAIHFSLDGNLLHKDSEEARRQQTRSGKQSEDSEAPEVKETNMGAPASGEEGAEEGAAEGDVKEDIGEDGAAVTSPSASQPKVKAKSEKKLTNQFNFNLDLKVFQDGTSHPKYYRYLTVDTASSYLFVGAMASKPIKNVFVLINSSDF
ncbi:hypothetical protein Btru_027610 [Bulinus truncatus]|nr:hypothetical protein Btru_027610 [Bulinus truncatus]